MARKLKRRKKSARPDFSGSQILAWARRWKTYLQATEEAYWHVKSALSNLHAALDLLPGANCAGYERVAISKSIEPLERVLVELTCFRFEPREQR
jgi:hypothetical protein